MATSRQGRESSSSVAQNSSRQHECSLCLEQYKSPRILPCFHTFCLVCLERLTQNSPRTDCFPCPSCRTSVQIPQGGVAKFQVNFYVEAAIESQQSGQGSSVRMCDMCGQQTATSKCTDCDQFACDNCTAIHARIGATRSHTVLNLNAQNQASPLVVKERYCNTHKDEKIRFFCTQCNCVLCRDCKLTSHEGHPTTDLSKKSQAAKTMLLSVTEITRQELAPKLKHSLKVTKKHGEDFASNKAQILSTLQERANSIRQKVDTCLKKVEQDLNQQSESIEKQVTETVDNMQQQIACLESLCDHAEQVTRAGCDADILSLPSEMVQFFGESSAVRATQQYGYQQHYQYDTRYSLPQGLDHAPRLHLFVYENWRQTIELTGSSEDNQKYDGRIQNMLEKTISQNVGTVTTVSAAGNTNQGAWGVQVDYLYNPGRGHTKGKHHQQGMCDEGIVDIPGISKDITDIQRLLAGWGKQRDDYPELDDGYPEMDDGYL